MHLRRRQTAIVQPDRRSQCRKLSVHDPVILGVLIAAQASKVDLALGDITPQLGLHGTHLQQDHWPSPGPQENGSVRRRHTKALPNELISVLGYSASRTA
jgi:hypothetical protein